MLLVVVSDLVLVRHGVQAAMGSNPRRGCGANSMQDPLPIEKEDVIWNGMRRRGSVEKQRERIGCTGEWIKCDLLRHLGQGSVTNRAFGREKCDVLSQFR